MKNYVVAILSFFENEVRMFKIEAENEYEAIKKGMIEFCEDEESKQSEIDYQNSEDYPTKYSELMYEEMSFKAIEVKQF